jgi:chromosome segregation ATPase
LPENAESPSPSKFKTQFLNIEKKFIDLELTVNELTEKIKSLEEKDTKILEEKISDLEDFIMVEQAGIVEIKKTLEDLGAKLESPAEYGKPIAEMQEKLKKIESSLSGMVPEGELAKKLDEMEKKIPATTTVDLEPVNSRLNKIEAQFGKEPDVEYKNRINKIEAELAVLKTTIETAHRNFYETLEEFRRKIDVEKKLPLDYEVVSSKIELLRNNLDQLARKETEFALKSSEFEKKFEIINQRITNTLNEPVLDEIKNNRKDIIGTGSKIESLEKIISDLNRDLQGVRGSIDKFESLEKATLLSKDIENKIERFKFIEEEMRRVSSKVEMIYDSIDKRLEKVKIADTKIDELSRVLDATRKEIDQNKVQLLERVKKEDMGGLYKKLNDIENKMKPELVMKMFEEFRNNVNHELMERARREEVKNIYDRLSNIEAKIKPELVDKMAQDFKSHINQQMSEIEDKYAKEFDHVRVLVEGAGSDLNSQFNEIVEKIIFLETKLDTLERFLQENAPPQPIILE